MRPIPLTRPKTPSSSVFLLWLAAVAAAAFSILVMFDPMEKPGPGMATSTPTASGTPVRDARAEMHLALALDWLLRHQQQGVWGFSGSDAGSDACKRCAPMELHGPGKLEGGAFAMLALVESGVADRPDGPEHRTLDSAHYWLDHLVNQCKGSPDAEQRIRDARDDAFVLLALSKGVRDFGKSGYRGTVGELAKRVLTLVRTEKIDATLRCEIYNALWSAREAGATLDSEALGRDIRIWLDSAADAEGRISESGGRDEHETLVAMGLDLRLQIGKDSGAPVLSTAVQRISCDMPVWSSPDFLYWYYGTQALMQCRQSQPQVWAKWSSRVLQLLVEHQRTDGCPCGSWDPVGKEQDRVWATAINAVTLARIIKYRSSIAVEQD